MSFRTICETNCVTNCVRRPDFWIALLWRRLSGGAAVPVALSVGDSGAPAAGLESDFRMHAVCAKADQGSPGGLLLVWSNSNDSGRGVKVTLADGLVGGLPATLWQLLPQNATAGLTDTSLTLNGGSSALQVRPRGWRT